MMKKYLVKQGDTLDALAEQFGIKDGQTLRSYHNTFCPLEDLLGYQLIPGKELLIPEDSKYMITEEGGDEDVDTMNDFHEGHQSSSSTQSKQEKEEKEGSKESSSSEHDGKYFVVQKGMCQCNQGFKFPKFKVTSHQKHYWNDENGEADYLAVTEDDTLLDPPAMPFGNCKLKPSSGGYLPCTYAPAGKWTKTYDKVKVMGKSCVTEISELMCSVGGKITILKHGQQTEAGKSHIMNANSQEQQIYNPIVNFDEFKKMLNEDLSDDYE